MIDETLVGRRPGGLHPKVAVVVPYFQRKVGVLRPAINAALRQEGVRDYRIIVVDDGSPLPANEELSDLSADDKKKLTVLTQRNAGPGAARNAGLENVDRDTEYVAFLDSDDVWTERHLENAIAGLERGYDFYFADFFFPDYKEKSAFTRAGKIDPREHELLDGQRALYAYRGDMTDQILVKGNVIGTSTVAYRFAKYPKLRFREQFFNGQDYMFWLEFSQLADRFVFSTRIECDYGTGVNIYSGAGWGADRSLQRLRNELFLWKSARTMLPLTQTQQTHNDQRIQRLREAIVRDLIHRVSHRKEIQKSVLIDLLRIDPSLAVSFLPISTRLALRKLRGL